MQKQPSSKGKPRKPLTKFKKPPMKVLQSATVEPPAPSLQVDQHSSLEVKHAPPAVNQPCRSGRKKKVRTAEEKAQREARKRQEELEFRELERSLDTLD